MLENGISTLKKVLLRLIKLTWIIFLRLEYLNNSKKQNAYHCRIDDKISELGWKESNVENQ